MDRSQSALLRNTLRVDAAFGALAGADLLLFSRPLAELLGVASSGILAVVGAGLLAYAAYLVVASRRDPLSTAEAWTFVAADLAWIAGSAALIVFAPLTTAGNWIVGIAAVAVLALAEAKMLGIRRIRRGATTLSLRHRAA